MGRIPEYNRRSFESSVDIGKIESAGHSLEAVGRLNQGAFESGTHLGNKYIEIKEKEFLAQNSLAYEIEASEELQKHQKKYESDPVGKYSEYNEKLNEIKTKYLENAPTQRSRRMFAQSSGLMNQKIAHNNKEWEVKRVAINTGERVQESLETVQTQALRVADPTQLKALLSKGDALMSPLKDTHSPEKINEAREKFNFNSALNSFDGMINNGQEEQAKSLLESKKFDEYLGDNGIKKVRRMISNAENSKKRVKKDFERLRLSNPYKYLDKTGVEYSFFEFKNGEDAIHERVNFIGDMKEQHNVELPFFAPDEIKLFKEKFSNGNNSERLNFLESIEKLPTDKSKVYSQMGLPREVGFFTNFKNNTDKELFVQAALSKDIKPTEQTPERDLKDAVNNSDIGSLLLDASSQLPSNTSLRESSQNLLNIIKNVSILKNDIDAGPKFFKENFNTIEKDWGIFNSSGSTKLFFSKDVDEDLLEDGLVNAKSELIKEKTKGHDAISANRIKTFLEDSTIWVNGKEGPILVETSSGRPVSLKHKLQFKDFVKKNKVKDKIANTTGIIGGEI